MHTRAPCTRPPARASPFLVLGPFRPALLLLVVRQCGHAGSAPAQAQDGGSACREVSLGGRLHSFVAQPRICAMSARSHALVLGVVLTITIDFAPTGDRYGRRSACHTRSFRTLSWASGEPRQFAQFLHAAHAHMRVLARSHAFAHTLDATMSRSISLVQTADTAGGPRAMHAPSAPSPGQVSLAMRLYFSAARPCMCAVSACSHALALGVALTIAIDFALAGARYGRRSACPT